MEMESNKWNGTKIENFSNAKPVAKAEIFAYLIMPIGKRLLLHVLVDK